MFREYPVSKILRQLERQELTPAIVFRTSRKQCDIDVQQLGRKNYARVSAENTAELEKKIEGLSKKHGWPLELFQKHPQYYSLVNYAAGAHHAGQLLPWRLMLEELMSAGLLRLLIATGTVAAGVDFPARTVVITAHSKRGHSGFNTLASSEFQQMSGRAGRRGKDTVGFCLMAPNPFCDARVLSDVAKSPPEPLRSSYFASPSTVLNLLKYRSVDDLKYTVQNSLAGFVDAKDAEALREEAKTVLMDAEKVINDDKREKLLRKKSRRMERQASELESKQIFLLEETLSALTKLGHLDENGNLTEKGLWAAELCTSLVLELAEAVEDFLFEGLSIQEMVGLVASIAGDPYRTYLRIKNTVVSKDKLDRLAEKVEMVSNIYTAHEFASEIAVVSEAAATVEAWLEAANWAEFSSLLKLSNVADGDASRIITQTADHLQQLGRLVDSHPTLSRQAMEARDLLLKPPISDVF